MFFSKIIEKKFDAVLGRYEWDPCRHYFSTEDFPTVTAQPYDIPADAEVLLKGFFYYRDRLQPEKLVIFDHGIGSGHQAYFKEIAFLANDGWTVYSYDHTGCAETGGTGILGFAQGINDLDHVLTALKKDPRFSGMPLRLVGHSWGGYSAMNAAALHPEVTHVVSLAGFLSARSLIEQYLPKMFLRYSEEVMDRERQHNPDYADMDARQSLQKSKAKLMHLQSEDDEKVLYERGLVPLSQALEGREDTEFVTLEHRNHEPQRTDGAAAAARQMLQERTRLEKKKRLSDDQQQRAFREAWDWELITRQDPVVWGKIEDFLSR